jgi:spermidine synthase
VNSQDQWVSENWENVQIRHRIKKVIKEVQTEFQHLLLVDSFEYGKMLLLDGVVQTTEKDEFVYHEMMSHVPLFSHSSPKRVLIIGGGDGGVLREVLKHDGVEKVTLVEIDPLVIDLCKEHLPSISHGGFEDRRTELVIADGATYLENTSNQYDVIIVDSPDPIGPAQTLFLKSFYDSIIQSMKPGGIMVRQTGNLESQAKEQIKANRLLKDIFTYIAFYVYTVPTYVGGLFSTVFCSPTMKPMSVERKTIEHKFGQSEFHTKYYTPTIHVGAFHIPPFMEEIL